MGQSTQTVEVAANAAMLTTENATVGTVIEQQRIVDLPLNGRSFFSLVALSPNVSFGFTPAQQASSRLGGSRSTLTISMSGARATWSNYTLDGISNTDIDFNTFILQPSVDALQEFNVQSGIYSAEFGREAGQVNVSTKPGTNTYHGAVFEFLRNNKLDARNYDFSAASRSATNPSLASTPYRQNQYGFTLEGPVRIPKLFNGTNRLFFISGSPNDILCSSAWKCSTLPTMWNSARRAQAGGQFECDAPVEFRFHYLDQGQHAADSVRAQV